MADIGAKIGIEGEKQFRDELKQITQQGKTLAAEMDNVSSAFKNADESEKDFSSVTKKLNEQIANQQKLVDKLKEAVARSTEKTGENSTETLKWKEKLAKAEKGLSDLEKQSRDAASGVDKLGDEEKETSDQTSIFGDVLKANLASEAIKKGLELTLNAVKDIAKFFAESVKGAAEYADEINTLAKTTGMNTDALQEYKYMAGLLDVELSTITSSMTKMEKAMASDSKIFGELGVATRDASGNLRDADDVFTDSVQALKKIKNPVERDAKAMELFGKSAKELNPLIETSSEDLEAMRKEAHDVGAVMDKETLTKLNAVQDGFERVSKAWEAIKRNLGARLGEKILPDLEKFVKLFQDFAKTGDITKLTDGIIRGLRNLVQKLPEKLKTELPKALSNFGKILGQLLGNTPSLIKAGVEMGAALLKGLVTSIPEMGRSIAQAFKESMLSDSTIEAISKIEELGRKIEEIPSKYDRMASSIGDVNAKQAEAEHWIQIFDELYQVTNPTAEQTARLQTAVDKLNELYPELGIAINKETGKWNYNTQSIRENISALSARYRAEAYYAAAGDTLQQIAQIEAETRSLRQQNTALGNAIANREGVERALRQEYNALAELEKQYGSMQMTTEEYNAALKQLGYDSRDLALNRLGELDTALKKNADVLYDMRAEYDAGKATLDAADEALKTLNGDVDWFFAQGEKWESEAYSVGTSISGGVAAGILAVKQKIEYAAGSVIASAIGQMKKIAEIHSPSKVTENLIGKNLALGVVKGWEDVFDSSKMRNAFSLNGAIGAMGSTTNTMNLGGVSIVVNGAQGQDANAIADLVMRKMQGAVDARRAVFA